MPCHESLPKRSCWILGFSVDSCAAAGEGWHRTGRNISYFRRHETDRYFTLSFEVDLPYPGHEDVLFFAYCCTLTRDDGIV